MKSLLKELVSVAQKCDDVGLYKEAQELDKIMIKLSGILEGDTKVGRVHQDENGNWVQKWISSDRKKTHYEPALPPKEEPVKEEKVEEKEKPYADNWNPYNRLMNALS